MSEDANLCLLLTDENFQRLLNQMRRRSVSWDEFLSYPQPRNISPLDSWDLLAEMGRAAGVPVPIPDYEGNHYWYQRTHEIDDAAIRIMSACQTDSRLHRVMNAAAGQQFVVKSQIEETVAAARLDGLDIDVVEAEDLLRLTRKPQTAEEQLLTNTFSAFEQLPSFIDVPFSEELFVHMQELLLKGVDVGALSPHAALQGLIHASKDWSVQQQVQYGTRQMRLIADYLNGRSSDADDLVFLRGELAADSFRYYHPLGPVSSQVGRLAGRLFALKNGLPGLLLLSLSKMKTDWESSLITPPRVTYDAASYAEVYQRSPFDLTAEHSLLVQLALIALDETCANIEQWEQRDAEVRQLLRGESQLNQRQRAIVGRAFRNPDAEFRIRYHQKNHGIHYTTARRDLLELVEEGYLIVEQIGKAFVFRRGPRLEELDRENGV